MTWGSLRIEVRDDEIIVTQPGSNFSAVYYKPRDEPQLIAKGTPSGNYRFLARACKAANEAVRKRLHSRHSRHLRSNKRLHSRSSPSCVAWLPI